MTSHADELEVSYLLHHPEQHRQASYTDEYNRHLAIWSTEQPQLENIRLTK